MLQEHLRRTARISRPSLAPKRKKGTHWIVYIFLGMVMIIIITLLLVTYDFSIHQPSIDETNNNEPDDVIIDRNLLKNLIDGISNINNNTNINNINDVSIHNNPIEKWPLQTSNNDDCSGIFGNGYSREIIQCSSNISSFKCVQNPFSNQIYCIGKNFIINPSMISIATGGESIESVAGRKEEAEFPKYNSNQNTGDSAFNINCNPQGNIPKKDGVSYYFKDIIEFMRNIDKDIYHKKYISDYNSLCKASNDNKLTIFLLTMRYEYANMYHQATDWYNFYQIIHSLDVIENNNYEIIFLDGHARSQIDSAWEYGINRGNNKYNFIKQLNNGKLLCLNNVIFISAGYVGGISLKTVFKGCKKENKYVKQFSEWFLLGFGIKINTQRKYNNISITLTCRKDYIAHPRNMIGKASRKFMNDKQVENKIIEIVNGISKGNDIQFNVRNIAWSDYTFREQLQIASSTDILIGVHGAGLSHVLFLPPKSGLIEITPIGFDGEPHFKAFSSWNGHKYNQVPGGNEYKVNPHYDKFKYAIKEQINFIQNNVY